MNDHAVDPDAVYLSFTRDAGGDAFCTIVVPGTGEQLRFGLEDLDGVAPTLDDAVANAVRRAAPALPGGKRVGIMVKVPGAPERLPAADASAAGVTGWDPASGRFFEESSIPFDELMLCVEKGEHGWRYHAFAKQDRCTRCQVLKDGTYL